MEEDIKENIADEEIEVASEKTEENDTKNDDSELRPNKSKSNDKKEVKQKTVKKSTQKNVSVKKVDSQSDTKSEKQVVNVQNLVTIVLPEAYLQTLTKTITIQESIVLEQGDVYEQDITAFSSNAAWDDFNNSANDRWNDMGRIRPVHSYNSYGN